MQETASVVQSEETVVRSMCSQCQNSCGILVHVKNGVVTKILGDPQNPRSNGFVCAKGQVGPQGIYSPYRVTKPLVRTNPEKGLEVDPRWKEVSWDEALSIIAERMKRVKSDDPRKLMFTSFDVAGGHSQEYSMFVNAFGSPNFTPGSADFFCGNSVHTMHYLNQAAFEAGVDLTYCKYLLQMGTQWGSVVNQQDTMHGTTALAEARAFNKTKVVVVDPWCSFAGSKANEWVPIRPGTDTAFILALVNVIVNEIGRYDEAYLKFRTNAPYLVGEDRAYLRGVDGKPLVWDTAENKAKPFDDPTVKDYALTGEFKVRGKLAKPGFQLLKDHVRKYTPESASRITTVPSETIRKIAKEWVENARIGDKVTIDGQELPFRPVAINWYRGASAHKHSASIGYAIMLLPTLVGAVDVPGGAMGENRMPWEGVTEDGLLTTRALSVVKNPYPPRPVTAPNSIFLFELFPIGPYSPVMVQLAQLNPSKYKPPYNLEILFQLKNNLVKSSGPTELMERWIGQIPFVVSFSTTIDETATMSDVVIPDLYYLERQSTRGMTTHPGIEGEFYEYLQRQVVPPPFEPPFDKITSVVDILLVIAEKAGFLDDLYDTMSQTYRLDESNRLQHGRKYSWNEIFDRKLRANYGEEHSLDWFKRNQVLTKPKSVAQAYPGAFREARIHLYYEFIEEARREVERVTKELGIPWETSDYQTLPDWKPCPAYAQKSPRFDLLIINAKLPMHTLSGSIYYPALQAMTGKHRLDRGVLMNAATGRSKGISHGDAVTIETETGKKANAIALLSEVVHPEVVVCFGSHGRRVAGIPNARGIGVDFNQLLELDEEHIDFVNGALDSCVRVSVSKADREAASVA